MKTSFYRFVRVSQKKYGDDIVIYGPDKKDPKYYRTVTVYTGDLASRTDVSFKGRGYFDRAEKYAMHFYETLTKVY